jgi:hypothetical protein
VGGPAKPPNSQFSRSLAICRVAFLKAVPAQAAPNRIDVTIYVFIFDPIGNPPFMLKTNENFERY